MKDLAELPLDILNHIHSFFQNAFPASALLCPREIQENGQLLCRNLLGLPKQKYWLIQYYMDIYEFIENSFYLSNHVFGKRSLFHPAGDSIFLEWLQADSLQRCSYREILTLIIKKHNRKHVYRDPECQNHYINQQCLARERHFVQTQPLLMDLMFSRDFLKNDRVKRWSMLSWTDVETRKAIAKRERKYNPLETLPTEEEFKKYVIFTIILNGLMFFPKYFPVFQLILRSQPVLLNMGLGNYAANLIDSAIRVNNFKILCHLIEQGADVNRNYDDSDGLWSVPAPLLLALQFLVDNENNPESFADYRKIVEKLLESNANVQQPSMLDSSAYVPKPYSNICNHFTPLEFSAAVLLEENHSVDLRAFLLTLCEYQFCNIF